MREGGREVREGGREGGKRGREGGRTTFFSSPAVISGHCRAVMEVYNRGVYSRVVTHTTPCMGAGWRVTRLGMEREMEWPLRNEMKIPH